MPSPQIFDKALVREHIERARPNIHAHDVLLQETQSEMLNRIADVKKTFYACLDLSPFPFLSDHRDFSQVSELNDASAWTTEAIPFPPETFDLVVCNMGLHWINDVPGYLAQIRALLKPEGMFMGCLLGEQTLFELRACLLEAELTVTGGISPRLSPTISLLTASQLMQRAGFTLPVCDLDSLTLVYSDMLHLMHELRGMGQSNAHKERLRKLTRPAVFSEAARLYSERYADPEGNIPASFDLIYLHGWK